MNGIEYVSPALLVFILSYMIYTERKVTRLCNFIKQLPCQIKKKRRKKCKTASSATEKS